jgi:hypothetical protein
VGLNTLLANSFLERWYYEKCYCACLTLYKLFIVKNKGLYSVNTGGKKPVEKGNEYESQEDLCEEDLTR